MRKKKKKKRYLSVTQPVITITIRPQRLVCNVIRQYTVTIRDTAAIKLCKSNIHLILNLYI